MLTVTDSQLAALLADRRAMLIDDVYGRLGLAGREQAAGYVAEAIFAGMTVERDVVALAELLARAERTGRSDRVRTLVADRSVPAELRIYQAGNAIEAS